MKLNKGEQLALKVLPRLGFSNLARERFVDFSADYERKRVLMEVKYRKRISNSFKLTKRQLNEANFILIINEQKHRIIKKTDTSKNEVTDYRIFF